MDTNNNTNTHLTIDPEELEAAEKEAKKAAQEDSLGVFTLKLRKPLTYNDKKYERLHFNFDRLTGQDSLNIEEEIEMVTGKVVLIPSISSQYMIRLAARACLEPVGSDIFPLMPVAEFNALKARVRSFLLGAEQLLETEDDGSDGNA